MGGRASPRRAALPTRKPRCRGAWSTWCGQRSPSVRDKDSREVGKDLPSIDQAATLSEAEQALDRFAQK